MKKSDTKLKIENLQLLFQAAVRDVLQRPDCDNDDNDDDDNVDDYVPIAVIVFTTLMIMVIASYQSQL